MAGIELRAISKMYDGGSYAVREVDLTIDDGEFMIFLGPSGCGKSTTLRMIAGLETITSGDLLIGGERVNDLDPSKRDISIVFQNYALYPHMSVARNLGFGLKLRGVPRREIAARVADVAALMGIGDLLDRRPAQLSGGQRQRVALGRALVREPSAFLLDEPLSNLDAKLRSVMRTELIKLHRRLGTTMVHVTHDQVEAMTMGQRICIMRDGRVVQTGAPLDVYAEPADTFVAGFLATPAMNLVPARLEADVGGLELRGEGFAIAVPEAYRSAYAPFSGKRVIAGLRPEDFRPGAAAGDEPGGIEATIETVEALGPETVLTLSLAGGTELAARIPGTGRYRAGDRITLGYDRVKLHLFDPDTTRRIARPKDPA